MTLWYLHLQRTDARGEEEAFYQINILFIDVDMEETAFPAFQPPPRDNWHFDDAQFMQRLLGVCIMYVNILS